MSKTSWPVKTLGEVCDFVRGVTYDKADARSDMKSGFIPLLRATNITEKGLLRDDFVFVPNNGVRADQKLVSGDALITIASGSASVVGRSVLVEDPGEMTFGAFCGVLRPSPEILPRYLSHFMSSRSVRTAWSEAAQGTNINNLKRDDILQTECLLPPLEEQKRIVALLDAATARVTELTACYEQARTHANNLFESLYDDCFEQQLADTPLGDIADLNGGYAFKSSDYTESGVFVLRTLNIDSKGDVTRRKEAFVSKARMEEFDRFKLFSGDILFVMVGATLGKTGVVKEADLPALLNQNMWVIRAKKDLIDQRYLYFVFMKYSKTLLSGAAGTARAFVKRDDFRNLFVPVPTLDEQKRIVVRLDSMKAKTSEMVAAYDAKLVAAKNLRQSVLEAAFAGEL